MTTWTNEQNVVVVDPYPLYDEDENYNTNQYYNPVFNDVGGNSDLIWEKSDR